MFLIDPEDLTVYKLPRSAFTSFETDIPKDPPISFGAFEAAAQKSYSTLVQVAAQGGRPCIFPGSITFVHLKDANGAAAGYAWASPVCVAHCHEYTFLPNRFLGRDFLLLWPYALAIHAWLSFKERQRFDPHLDAAGRMLANHPPSVLQKKGLADVAHEGEVAPRDLASHQRFFVASLRPNLPRFALRQPEDDWCKRLRETEAGALVRQLNAQVSAPWRMRPVQPPPAQAFSHLRPPPKRGNAPLDLPDELVGRIVSLRLAEDLAVTESAVAAVAALSSVSRQFHECTRDVVARMLARVQPLCLQLHGPDPPPPAWIQIMLWAAGLTLRGAFAPELGKWPSYVRERRKLLAHERAQWRDPGDGAKRHALLWE